MTGDNHPMPSASEEQQQQRQQQQKAWKAYLEPLLRKHEAHQLVTYEDLTASKAAADRLITANKDTTATVRPCLAASAQYKIQDAMVSFTHVISVSFPISIACAVCLVSLLVPLRSFIPCFFASIHSFWHTEIHSGIASDAGQGLPRGGHRGPPNPGSVHSWLLRGLGTASQ
jgi:hypothetical protein